jgi:hypothetical protein
MGSLFPWVIAFLNSNIVSNQIISIVSNHRRFYLNRWKSSSSNQFRIMTNHMKNATQITFALVFIYSLVSSKWVRLELHQRGGGGWCSSTYVRFQFQHMMVCLIIQPDSSTHLIVRKLLDYYCIHHPWKNLLKKLAKSVKEIVQVFRYIFSSV